MKMKANFLYKPGSFQMDDCRIEKVVELSAEAFSALVVTPLRDHPAVAENKDCMFSKDGVMHCLLALSPGRTDGLLIESEGYNFPRYAAYVPGIRDIVNAEMDRAADYIIRQGTERTAGGSWCVSVEKLEERLGLTVRDGNGLDIKLREALERRPEVAGVTLEGGYVNAAFRPDCCKSLDHAQKLPSVGLDTFLSSRRTPELIATYEELYCIPEAERVTFYYGDYGGHFLKHGASDANVLTACGMALAAIEMSGREFLQSEDFTCRGGIIARMQNCMLGQDTRLRDVLERWPGSEFDCVVHSEDDSCRVSVPAFVQLTGAGREDFAALLDARVEKVRAGDSGLETVISGVAPQELERFRDAYDAHEQAEQGMWMM